MAEIRTSEAPVREIEEWVASGAPPEKLLECLRGMHPADIAEVLDDLNEGAAIAVFNALTLDVASEVLDETDVEITRRLFERVPNEKLALLLSHLPMDDAARLLAELEHEQAETLLRLMSPAAASGVRHLLAYPEGSAGRIMNEHVARLRSTWTITEALTFLRGVNRDVETVLYLYVTDEEGRLTGVVPLRRLITAPPSAFIRDIQVSQVQAVHVLDDQEEVAEVVAKYDFYAVPVLDENGRLVGVVTADDIVDVLEAEATEDIQRFGGSEPLNNPYFALSIWEMARKRINWLVILFAGGILTSSVVGIYEAELEQVLILSFFIPLLIGTGGNAGSQTVSTTIRAMAVGEVAWGDMLRVTQREILTGLLAGSLLGVIGYFYTLFFWQTGLDVALVIGLTLPLICTWANLVASIVPLIADRAGVDPALISAPLITTLVDATGLIIYFTIAKLILGI
jgi:magnesium transporter